MSTPDGFTRYKATTTFFAVPRSTSGTLHKVYVNKGQTVYLSEDRKTALIELVDPFLPTTVGNMWLVLDEDKPKPEDFDGPNPPDSFTDNVGNTFDRVPCPYCQTMADCDCGLELI